MAKTATPKEKLLAAALGEAKEKARDGIIRFSDLSRVRRERLLKAGWLKEIIKGWYVLINPKMSSGESTGWYLSYWTFLKAYLESRFNKNYCLSAESSLDLLTGLNTIPKQTVVIVGRGSHSVLRLPYETSLLIYQDKKNLPDARIEKNWIQVMPLPLALCRVAPSRFIDKPREMEIALRMVDDISELSRFALKGGYIASMGRIAGAYRFLGDETKAKRIVKDLNIAGYPVTPENPFQIQEPTLNGTARVTSPYAARIESMWKKMRADVLKVFPAPPQRRLSKKQVFAGIEDAYVHDAYNSLSIEGYQVTEELIKKIRDGDWNPDQNQGDQNQRDALAAKGYRGAFEKVKIGISKMLDGENPGSVIEDELQDWYRGLFLPSVKAGLLRSHHLVGYRDIRVGIRGSMHVPPPKEAVTDCMEKFFDLLKTEKEASVRAVLGHFIFVFIHPYADGNGRLGRFIMNSMLVSGRYDWTVVRVERRESYLASLEKASVLGEITDFAKFLAEEMKAR